MKATLRFNLDDLDERLKHLQCIHAPDMASALWNIKQKIVALNDGHLNHGAFVAHVIDILADIDIDSMYV